MPRRESISSHQLLLCYRYFYFEYEAQMPPYAASLSSQQASQIADYRRGDARCSLCALMILRCGRVSAIFINLAPTIYTQISTRRFRRRLVTYLPLTTKRGLNTLLKGYLQACTTMALLRQRLLDAEHTLRSRRLIYASPI